MFFQWISDGFRLLQGGFRNAGDWINGIPVVGGSLASTFYQIAAWLLWISDLFRGLQVFWSWLLDSWVPWIESRIRSLDDWISNYTARLADQLSASEIAAWAQANFRPAVWIRQAQEWLDWLNEWSSWVEGRISSALSWEGIREQIEQAFNLSVLLAWMRSQFLFLDDWRLWAQSEIARALDPVNIWEAAKRRIDLALETEASWLLSLGAGVLDRLWDDPGWPPPRGRVGIL